MYSNGQHEVNFHILIKIINQFHLAYNDDLMSEIVLKPEGRFGK